MILIAEDELEIREAYKELIESGGYEAKIFKDGNEILQYLMKQEVLEDSSSSKRPQLIITDLRMPERSGDDFIKTFHKMSLKYQDVPIFIISGMVEKNILDKYQNKKTVKCFSKPISGGLLLDHINQACSN